MSDEKVCAVCRITESEAERNGLMLACCDEVAPDLEKLFREMGVEVKQGEFLCTACRAGLLNTLTHGKLNKDIEKSMAFLGFIDSSAHLFGLEQGQVIQSCFNLFLTGVKSNLVLQQR